MSKIHPRLLRLVPMALLSLLLTTSTGAELPPREVSPEFAAKILKDWNDELLQVDEFLREGRGQKAYKSTGRLLSQMTDQFVSGPDVDRFLGLATLLRAVAAYQLGREEEALWHWQVAVQMFPEVSEFRLAEYGEAGRFLESQPLPEKPSQVTKRPAQEVRSVPADDIEPPRRKYRPSIRLPVAKRNGERLSVVVRVRLGKDGRPREPRIVDARGELTVVCAVLDAMRQWTFEPARRNGEPVEIFYQLEWNYSPSGKRP